MAECCSKCKRILTILSHWGKKQRFIRWMDKAQCRPRFLSLVSDERKRANLVNKSGQYASFYHASRRRSPRCRQWSVRPLTTHGCDESRLMANWLKVKKWKSNAFWWARSCEPSNTWRSRGLSEPAFQCRSSAGVTPCGDVGLVGAYLQALTNEVLLRYWWSPTYR